ncbi:hypothetical protein [Devosia sp. 1635]|uniref:hypothetical protein n=1 Tax=Devosia sp. 1635 TaxID=2726066 RepID=UPI00156518B7|nr:hypothetical protein [Devosia sp. 1635]
MGKIMLLYDNQSDIGSVTGPASALPVANLQIDTLEQVWRSASDDPSDTRFDVALPEVVAMKAIVVGPTNLTTANRYRVRAFPDASRSNAFYDSGWEQSAVRATFGSLPWGSPYLWSGYQPPDDPDRGTFIIHVLPYAVAQLFWTIEIDDEGNPDGFIEASRLLMCRTVEPSINYQVGQNGLAFEDNSKRSRTLGGGEQIWRRINPRVFQFGFDYLPESEAFNDFYDLMRHTGYDREVFVIPDPDASALEMQRRSFLGTFSQMNPLSQVAFGYAAAGFTIKERI